MASTTDIIVQPWGGSGGSYWNFRPHKKLSQIVIAYSSVPVSITFISITDDGSEASMKVGGEGPEKGDYTATVNIDGANEYLTGISGTYGDYADNTVLRSIKFYTNIQEFGPYGSDDGTPFSFVIQGGEIVGFHGRSGHYVDAIGTYIAPK